MKNVINLTFGINSNALTIATIIERMQDFAEDNLTVHSYPFYNGREKSIAIVAHCKSDWAHGTVIVFGENRNSDDLFIDTWQTSNVWDAPTVEDFTEEAYKNRQYFKYHEFYKVAKAVVAMLSNIVVNAKSIDNYISPNGTQLHSHKTAMAIANKYASK